MANWVFTRCWCCSELKRIDMQHGERLCQDCINDMDKTLNQMDYSEIVEQNPEDLKELDPELLKELNVK